MKSLIDCAGRAGAEFEIYSRSSETKAVSIENSELKDVKSCLTSGVSLRLIKNGRSGLSFTRNLTDPEVLVENAMASLRAGVEAEFSFPCTKTQAKLRTYSEKAGQITSDELLAECFRTRDLLARKAEAQVNASAQLFVSECRLTNSAGTDLTWKESSVEKYGSLVSAGGSAYAAGDTGFDLLPMPEASLLNVARLFEADQTEIRPEAGKQKVLFMPCAMNTLLWRVQSGTSGQSLHQKISPLAGRIGEKVFSEILTLRNNPLNDSIPGARSVDDEGVPCSDFPLIDRGVFKGFYYDLNFAAKTGSVPTGHGFRRSMWGGDPVILKPQPYLGHLYFDRGENSFDALLKEMGKGLVVFSTLGDHTGNIPNGDFSVGLSLGLCVENGRIIGKAKDTMVSGNIYDIMKRAVAVGSESEPAYSNNPPVLFDGVDVSS
jgi:PmbA protein